MKKCLNQKSLIYRVFQDNGIFYLEIPVHLVNPDSDELILNKK